MFSVSRTAQEELKARHPSYLQRAILAAPWRDLEDTRLRGHRLRGRLALAGGVSILGVPQGDSVASTLGGVGTPHC